MLTLFGILFYCVLDCVDVVIFGECQITAKIPPIKPRMKPTKKPPPLIMLITENTITNIPPVLILSGSSLLIIVDPMITSTPDINPIKMNARLIVKI